MPNCFLLYSFSSAALDVRRHSIDFSIKFINLSLSYVISNIVFETREEKKIELIFCCGFRFDLIFYVCRALRSINMLE